MPFLKDISNTNYFFDPNLGEGLCIFTSFHFPDSGLICPTVLVFILIYFEWRDNENQQLLVIRGGGVPSDSPNPDHISDQYLLGNVRKYQGIFESENERYQL